MTTWAATISGREQQVGQAFAIEGICSLTTGTQYKFCSEVPGYGSSTYYLKWLVGWPSQMSERISPLGGLIESGDGAFVLTDYADQVTALLQLADHASTKLSNLTLNLTSPTVVVDDISDIVINSVIFIGAEAMLVTFVAANVLTVTRGVGGTEASTHVGGDYVYTRSPFLHGRRIVRYVYPIDATSSAEEQAIDTLYLDGKALDEDYAGIAIAGRTSNYLLGRLLNSAAGYEFRVETGADGGISAALVHSGPLQNRGVGSAAAAQAYLFGGWSDSPLYGTALINDSEIVGITDLLYLTGRGLGETKQSEIVDGASLKPALLADVDGPNPAYRYSKVSDGPSIVRSAGFHTTDHGCDIMLCLLTSSAGGDGLELINYDAGYGNWSSLLPGIGAGIPYSKINIASFVAVKARFPEARFPGFALGGTSDSIGKVISDSFLQPMGWSIAVISGQITLIAPRLPVASDLSTTWDDDVIQRRQGSSGGWVHDLGSVAGDMSLLKSTVKFVCRGANAAEREMIFTVADYPSLLGATKFYGIGDGAIEVKAKAINADSSGAAAMLARLALRWLFRFSNVLLRMHPRTDLSQGNVVLGNVLGLTNGTIPNEITGARGVTSMPLEILGKSLEISDKSVTYAWDAVGFPPGVLAGKICPSANVVSSAGAGPYVVTVTANRYLQSDSSLAGLQTKDARAFAVNDVVRLIDTSGASAGGGTATVSAVSDTTVTISTNFGGALAAGTVLVYAGYTESVAAQKAAYAYYASALTFTISGGGAAARAWIYGEP